MDKELLIKQIIKTATKADKSKYFADYERYMAQYKALKHKLYKTYGFTVIKCY